MEPPMTNLVRLLLPRVYVFEGGHNRKVLGIWNLGMLHHDLHVHAACLMVSEYQP